MGGVINLQSLQSTKKKSFLSKDLTFSLVSIVLALLVGGFAILIAGCNPVKAYLRMFMEVFKNFQRISYMSNHVVLLILTGLSVAFAFRTGLFNIGAEGQYMIGMLVATLVGYLIKLPMILHIPITIITASVAAGVWGWISGYLKAKFQVNEVISNIMLNWIAFYVSNFIVVRRGIQVPDTGFTHYIHKSARISLTQFPQIFGSANLNLGIILAVIAAIFIKYLIFQTTVGYKLRAVGHNPLAAESAGINVGKSIMQSMFIAGVLAGIAGAINVMGTTFRATQLGGFIGYGMDGMAISLIGLNTPYGVMLSALFFGFLKYGVTFLQSDFSISDDIIQLIMGSVMYFVAIAYIIRYLYQNVENFFKSSNVSSSDKSIDIISETEGNSMSTDKQDQLVGDNSNNNGDVNI